MVTPVITHSKVSGKTQGTDSTRVYGNHWDANHVVTGLENVPNVDTTNASNLSSGTVPAAQMPALTGDVTTTVGTVATAIGATKVTSAMLNADVFSTAHSWAGQQTLVAPILGTPASGVATNLTGTAAGLTAGNATLAVTVTTNANLTGPITSVGNATSIASQTGTGTKFVVDTTPTLVTPVLGVATATSVNKVAITAPATSATLTIPNGVTLTGPASSGTAMTLGNTETVTGVKTFGSAGAVGRLVVAGTTSGSTVLDATAVASGTLTLPAATDTLVGKATTDTLTNKTINTASNNIIVSSVSVTAGVYPGTATNDAAAAGNVGELISAQAPYDAVGATVTITIASPGVVTWTAHGLVNTAVDGNAVAPVFFTTTGALPTGIVANTTYYVIGSSITTNTFQIATTVANAIAGTAINTSGTQSGVQTALKGLRIGTTSTAVDVIGISLTAGDWDVGGLIQLQPISAATITLVESYISTVSVTRAASPAGGTYFFDQQSKTAGTGMAAYIGKRRISIASTTTVYFGAFTQFTGTALNITAYLGARRVR